MGEDKAKKTMTDSPYQPATTGLQDLNHEPAGLDSGASQISNHEPPELDSRASEDLNHEPPDM